MGMFEMNDLMNYYGLSSLDSDMSSAMYKLDESQSPDLYSVNNNCGSETSNSFCKRLSASHKWVGVQRVYYFCCIY